MDSSYTFQRCGRATLCSNTDKTGAAFLNGRGILPKAQCTRNVFPSGQGTGQYVHEGQHPCDCKTCTSPLKTTFRSLCFKTKGHGNAAPVRRQDTDVLMSLDGTSVSTTVRPKFQASCIGTRQFPPFVERIISVVHSAKIRSKRILAGNALFSWRRERTARSDSAHTARVLNDLRPGAILADKYRLDGERVNGDPSVRYAVNTSSGNKVFLHFYDDLVSLKAAEAYHGSVSSVSTCRWMNTVCDVTDCPPFLVFEGGDYTFDQWIAQTHRMLDERRYAMREILEVLADVHNQGRVIGSLAPHRIVWFSAEHSWKLLDLCETNVQRRHRLPLPHNDVRYAAPEIVLSEFWEETQTVPDSSSDMWSFGVMVLETLLPGRSLEYPDVCPNADRRIALSRQIAQRLLSVTGEHAHTLLRNLLHTDPIKRCTASQALRSAFFQMPDQPRKANVLQNEIRHLLIPESVETALSGTAKTSISVEYFRKRSNPSDPFYLRPCRESYSITDAALPGQSIFLVKAGHNFRLRIRHECHASLHSAPPRIKAVYARIDEGEYIKLDTQLMIGQRRSLEVVALVEPTRLQSPRLLVSTPTDGLGEKYVKLDVVMDVVLNDDVEYVEKRQHVIYCWVLPRTSRLRRRYLCNNCGDAYHPVHPQNNI